MLQIEKPLVDSVQEQEVPDGPGGLDASGFRKLPEGYTRSIKYWVEADGRGYSVFAPDPIEARRRAIKAFDLDENANFVVYRMAEPSNILMRIN